VETTPVREEVLRYLGLDGQFALRLHHQDVQTGFFADERAIYFPVDLGLRSESSKLCAIRRGDGRLLWRWSGLTGCQIQRAGIHGDRIVIFEFSSPRSRLSILDKNGTVVRTHLLAEDAAVRNWPESEREEPVPDTLLFTDKDGIHRLTCISLFREGPNFRRDLMNVGRILRSPILGDGYVLIPVSRQISRPPSVVVRDLDTWRGALPEGRATLRLELSLPLQVFAHDDVVVLESFERIEVLGVGERDR
jgi:hypothetical protein